jgi:hypothetical protein
MMAVITMLVAMTVAFTMTVVTVSKRRRYRQSTYHGNESEYRYKLAAARPEQPA